MLALYVDFDNVFILVRLVILECEIVNKLFIGKLLNVGAWQIYEYLYESSITHMEESKVFVATRAIE